MSSGYHDNQDSIGSNNHSQSKWITTGFPSELRIQRLRGINGSFISLTSCMTFWECPEFWRPSDRPRAMGGWWRANSSSLSSLPCCVKPSSISFSPCTEQHGSESLPTATGKQTIREWSEIKQLQITYILHRMWVICYYRMIILKFQRLSSPILPGVLVTRRAGWQDTGWSPWISSLILIFEWHFF